MTKYQGWILLYVNYKYNWIKLTSYVFTSIHTFLSSYRNNTIMASNRITRSPFSKSSSWSSILEYQKKIIKCKNRLHHPLTQCDVLLFCSGVVIVFLRLYLYFGLTRNPWANPVKFIRKIVIGNWTCSHGIIKLFMSYLRKMYSIVVYLLK